MQKKGDVPIRIAHSHITSSNRIFYKNVYKFYAARELKKHATHNLACSRGAGKYLFKDREFLVFNNAIDLEKFRFCSSKRNLECEQLGINEDDRVIGHVGRFNYQKNHSFLIDIFYEYLKIKRNSYLVFNWRWRPKACD